MSYKTPILLVLLVLSSCGFKVIVEGGKNFVISGKVLPLNGSIVQHDSSQGFLGSAYAAVCSDPVYARLYHLEDDGSILQNSPLMSQEVGSDARYSFDLSSLNHKETVQYMVRAEGCNGNIYNRPVTNFDDKQDLDARTTLVSQVLNAHSLLPRKLNEVERKEVELLIQSIQGLTPADAFHSVTTQPTASSKFTEIFGAAPTIISDARPEVGLYNISTSLSEHSPHYFTSYTFHVDPNYSFAYRWKLNGVPVATTKDWTFTPTGNQQGQHQIDYYVGQDNGLGSIDLSKPYYVRSFMITVNNNVLPTAPVISIDPSTPSPRSTNTVTLSLDTGMAMASCDSFSDMAITETSSTPGPLQFVLNCSSAVAQSESVTFSNGDGAKTLYLWARDGAGVISSPKTVSLVLDATAPSTSLSLAEVLFRGGASVPLNISASDAGTGINSLRLYYADDGLTYTLVANIPATSTSYTWTTPSTNTISGKLKLVAIDNSGLQSESYSSDLTIDSTTPSAPLLTRLSPLISNSSAVQYQVSDCTGIPQIMENESTAPSLSDAGWKPCSTSSTYTYSVSGQGPHTINVWSQDDAGNISSTAGSISMTYDSVGPTVTLTSLTGGQKISGNISQTPAINTQLITWTASDNGSGLTNNPISLSYSIDSGVTWSSIASSLPNSGSYTWTVPAINNSGVRIRASATDQANNTINADSTTDFIIDSIAPSISALASQQGGVVAQPFVTLNSVVSDATSANGSLQMQIRDGANVWSDSLWTTFNSSQGFSFGFVQGAHILNFFVRDEAGNVAQSSISVTLDSGTPPIVRILAPVDGTLMPSGSNQTLSIHVHDVEAPMPADSVRIAYSLDNGISWIDFGSTFSPYSNSSTLSDETLSVTWPNVPATVTGKAVRFRITASDAAGNTIRWLSNFYNTSVLRRIAGGVSDVNGVSAKFTMLNTKQYFDTAPLNRFIRDPMTNDFFLGDLNQGLRYIDGATGVIQPGPLAGGAHALMTRDNFGNIYGCNATGIYKFDRSTLSWITYLAQPCDNISAWRNYRDRLYFVRGYKLYYYDGSTVTWVAFNGSNDMLSPPTDYALDPLDPKTGKYPKVSINNQFAVDYNGNVTFTDNCGYHGHVSGCPSNLRLLTYNRNTDTVTASAETYSRSNLFFRYFNNQLIGVSGGIYDEDPSTGSLFLYSAGQVKQYAPDITFNTHVHQGNTPASETHLTALLAGQLADSGDNDLATLSHLNLPTHLFVGPPGSSDADAIFVPKGNNCCFSWGSIRRFIVDGNIESFGNDGNYTRNYVASPLFPSTTEGYFSWWQRAQKTSSTSVSSLWGNTSTCTSSPTDGASASANNWPYTASYAPNYRSGLHHSDGHIYLGGYRNTTMGSPNCTGMADIFIKRFSLDSTTNGVGSVEHVVGAAGVPAISEPAGTGQDASTFLFGPSTIGQMRENRNLGASGNIFFIQGNRVRVLDRVTPSDPTTWKVYDVTKVINGIRSFVIDSGVDGLGTSGYLYYVTGNSHIYRYHLGSGISLTDDTVTTITPGGLTVLDITSIDILSNGRLVFTDNKANGAVYEYTP